MFKQLLSSQKYGLDRRSVKLIPDLLLRGTDVLNATVCHNREILVVPSTGKLVKCSTDQLISFENWNYFIQISIHIFEIVKLSSRISESRAVRTRLGRWKVLILISEWGIPLLRLIFSLAPSSVVRYRYLFRFIMKVMQSQSVKDRTGKNNEVKLTEFFDFMNFAYCFSIRAKW